MFTVRSAESVVDMIGAHQNRPQKFTSRIEQSGYWLMTIREVLVIVTSQLGKSGIKK
jgi:hypothetical protein